MSLVGKKIEEFSTDAYLGGKFIKVSDKDFYGKWNVLCFYPADFSFVCPTELEDLEETYPELKKTRSRSLLCFNRYSFCSCCMA